MLSPDQEKWLAHLPDNDRITIIPFDASAKEKFEAVKIKIQAVLGKDFQVFHRGATNLGISGQDEIDIYVPVPENQFNSLIAPLTAAFGNPRSHYPLERVRFATIEEGKHVDIFLINESCQGWLDGVKFENYLISNPTVLQDYRLLKEASEGLSMREYYYRKLLFFNEIMALINQTP